MNRALFLTALAMAVTPMNPTSNKISLATQLLNGKLKKFIPVMQRRVIASNLRGEEGEWFADKLIEIDGIIEKMPKSYETEGQGANAVVHLHYFGGGTFNAWVTEKDAEGGTQQAFGKQDLFGDGGELGYISIDEIVASNRTELDLHWTPKPLKECGVTE
jgi:hypothetical protein